MSVHLSVSYILQQPFFARSQPVCQPGHPQIREEYCSFCKESQLHTLLEEVTPSSHLAGPAGLLLLCNACQACSLY